MTVFRSILSPSFTHSLSHPRQSASHCSIIAEFNSLCQLELCGTALCVLPSRTLFVCSTVWEEERGVWKMIKIDRHPV